MSGRGSGPDAAADVSAGTGEIYSIDVPLIKKHWSGLFEMEAEVQRSSLRLDKWLWAARFFKTRSLASQAIDLGRVRLNGNRIKPAHATHVGDELEVVIGDTRFEIIVRGLSAQRGPAPVARALYEETAASLARREQAHLLRRHGQEPAQTIKGRPTKKQGRELRRLRSEKDA
jgi:ribosome-associated heat shock protein Hsp15